MTFGWSFLSLKQVLKSWDCSPMREKLRKNTVISLVYVEIKYTAEVFGTTLLIHVYTSVHGWNTQICNCLTGIIRLSMRVESGDIRYPHFSGDNQTDCTRPFFLPRKKRPGPEARVGSRNMVLDDFVSSPDPSPSRGKRIL